MAELRFESSEGIAIVPTTGTYLQEVVAVSQGRSEKRDSLSIENWFKSSGSPRIGDSAEGALMIWFL